VRLRLDTSPWAPMMDGTAAEQRLLVRRHGNQVISSAVLWDTWMGLW